ncbi:MAG: UbiA family prenyltransferase [Planctomycetes bacterium]|nr:UbiA family prenyltransferase [Planctomycetota bacterium]
MSTLRAIIKVTRPKQYLKNILVLFGFLFSGTFKEHLYESGIASLIAFVSFLLISSAVYVFNDIKDKDADKLHPKKKFRPIASGELGVGTAFLCLIVFLAGGFTAGYFVNYHFLSCLAAYLLINICYSLFLKYIAIVDVFCVSSGYVIRTIAGVFAVHAVTTIWLVLCITFVALFITFSKRRGDLSTLGERAALVNRTLGFYSVSFLDAMIIFNAVMALVTYILFVIFLISKGQSQLLVVTIPFIMFAVYRYIYLVLTTGNADSPETLIRDKMLMINNIIWLVLFLLTKFDYLKISGSLFELYLR